LSRRLGAADRFGRRLFHAHHMAMRVMGVLLGRARMAVTAIRLGPCSRSLWTRRRRSSFRLVRVDSVIIGCGW
jgi:hypothetical protein